MNALAWTPQDGETVHFRAASHRGLQSGRYRLERQPGDGESYWLHAVTGFGTGFGTGAMSAAQLQHMEASGQVTPIDPAELERDRQALELRALAPLRGNRRGPALAQHDAGELALFRHAGEPELGL